MRDDLPVEQILDGGQVKHLVPIGKIDDIRNQLPQGRFRREIALQQVRSDIVGLSGPFAPLHLHPTIPTILLHDSLDRLPIHRPALLAQKVPDGPVAIAELVPDAERLNPLLECAQPLWIRTGLLPLPLPAVVGGARDPEQLTESPWIGRLDRLHLTGQIH